MVLEFSSQHPHLDSSSLTLHSHVILECVKLTIKTSSRTGEAHAVVNGILVLADLLFSMATLVGYLFVSATSQL